MEEEFAGRVLQYLVERHYVQVSEMPAMLQALGDDFDGTLAAFVQRTLGAKLAGTNAAAVPSEAVARLADPEVLEKSWHDFLAGTPRYKELLREWEEQSKSDSAAPKPEPWDVVQEPLSAIVQIGFSGEPDRLTVRLSLPVKPIHTNGRWDESAKSVVWEHALEPDVTDAALPPYCYALWSRPNEEYQRQRFGSVRLQGNDLLEYCLWYASLTSKRAAEWNAVLNSLSPGESIRPKLEAFRFSEPLPGALYPLATRVPSSIVDALAGDLLSETE